MKVNVTKRLIQRMSKLILEILRYIRYRSGTQIFSETGEDALLWQIFRGEQGEYLDIGAQHPYLGSNTYSFYKKGWRGIAIEPQSDFNYLWKLLRRRDILINKVVSKSKTPIPFAKFKNSLISTGREEIVEKHISRGLEPIIFSAKTCKVSEVIDKKITYLDSFFISIDVEGMELEVLQTIDFNIHQPRAILLESWQQPWVIQNPITKFLDDTGLYQLYAYTGLTALYVHTSYILRLRGLREFLAE